MSAFRLLLVGCLAAALASCNDAPAAPPPAPSNSLAFVGSTPCADPVTSILGIPANAEEWIQWSLTLHREPKTQAPAGYELHCSSRAYIPQSSGQSRETHPADRRGDWRLMEGIPSNPHARVVQLDGVCDLVYVGDDVLHLLNRDHSLMSRDGGWSFTLNNQAAAEPPVEPNEVEFPANDSYKLTPLASGPEVFGIFVGRSPIKRIWQELGRTGPLDSMKAKWRLTLFHDPATGAPTTYRIDGTLYREGLMKDPQEPREGTWTITEDPSTNCVIYELGPWQTEPGLNLLVGDENVLFFLDAKDTPLVGGLDFSYTLNRRTSTERNTSAKP